MAKLKLILTNKQLLTVDAIKENQNQSLKTIQIGQTSHPIDINNNNLMFNGTYFDDGSILGNIAAIPKDFINNSLPDPLPKLASQALINLNTRLSQVDNWETRIAALELLIGNLTGIVNSFNDRLVSLEANKVIYSRPVSPIMINQGIKITNIAIVTFLNAMRTLNYLGFVRLYSGLWLDVVFNPSNDAIYLLYSNIYPVGTVTVGQLRFGDLIFIQILENNIPSSIYSSMANGFTVSNTIDGTWNGGINPPSTSIEVLEMVLIPINRTPEDI